MKYILINDIEEYFKLGDYTHWYKNYYEENPDYEGDYDDFIENILIPEMKKYDELQLYEDGCLYGVVSGMSTDISYEEFNPNREPEIFEEIAEALDEEILGEK